VSRKNAYKVCNINEIEDEVEISLDNFSQTINDRYIARFLNRSDNVETIAELITTLIESDYDTVGVAIEDWEDLMLLVTVSSEWIVRCEQEKYHVDTKVQFLLRDEELGESYEHIGLYRVIIVPKR
jgi:hypothetical protein